MAQAAREGWINDGRLEKDGSTMPITNCSAPGLTESDVVSSSRAECGPIRLMVGVPVHGQVAAGFASSIARAAAFFAGLPYNGEKTLEILFCQSSNLPDQRTILVSKAFQKNATHLLWLDSDMHFPPDTFNRLLNHNLPVVACSYPQKTIEARPTAYVESDEYVGPLWIPDDAVGIRQAAHCGMGIMLTDMRVYEAIELPFFIFEPQPPDFIAQASEDVYFCRKLRTANIPVYVDCDLSRQVGHIGEFVYTHVMSNAAEDVKQQLCRRPPE